MTTKLSLVSIARNTRPRALRESAAASYIGLSRPNFLGLVRAGEIPYFTHLGHSQRMYLVDDLEAYLLSRPKIIMGARENSLKALEGGSTK